MTHSRTKKIRKSLHQDKMTLNLLSREESLAQNELET